MEFRHFREEDYQAVCDFLIALNEPGRSHINWNWARFEWMYEHPEFDKNAKSAIGLWTDGDRVVGAAIYDMYFGEAFCAALPEYASLFPEILAYAYDALKDENGLAIALCDENAAEIEAARKQGFVPTEQSETMMEADLGRDFAPAFPEGLHAESPDPVKDAYAIQWLFWQGFDHGGDRAEFERTEQIVPQARRHFLPELGVAAVNRSGEPVAICCLWHDERTDYAYTEPVCTIPAYRGRGAGRAVVYEALNRAKARGAKKAYVISDQPFYEKLGFRRCRRFTFYRKR